MKKNYYLTAIVLLAGSLVSTNVLADYASDIEQDPNGAAITYDNAYDGDYPVVTAVLSQGVGAMDGYTYGNYAFLAADATGSLDIFYSSAASTYRPTVGDAVQVSGTYSPFDGIPEVESAAPAAISITKISAGNPVPAPISTTVSAINLGTGPTSSTAAYSAWLADNKINGGPGIAGQYLQLTGATINAGTATVFPTHANGTYSVTDSSGTMILFFWASSYSTDGAQAGMTIPTGPVTLDGFVDTFTGTATSSSGTIDTAESEFVETSIVVPEPSVLSLYGLGGVVSFLGLKYRSRKKA